LSREDKIHQDRILEECRKRVRELEDSSTRKLHPIAAYLLRTIGIVSILGGGAGDMIGVSFPFWAGAISLGLILLLIDPWIEPSLRLANVTWKIGLSAIFLIAFISFLHWIVFLSAPMKITARDYNEDYLPNTHTLFGVEWKEDYSDLRVVFENPTDFAYKNIDFNIEPIGLLVAAEAQTSNLSGVQLFNTKKGQDIVTMTSTDTKTGKKSYVPQKDEQFMAGTIRLLCDTLPKHSMFEVILAVHVIPEGILVREQPRRPLFTSRLPAKLVRVYGTYESRGGKPHDVEKTMPVTLN
jgi:hypothetical protein